MPGGFQSTRDAKSVAAHHGRSFLLRALAGCIVLALGAAACGPVYWTEAPWDDATFKRDDSECLAQIKSTYGPAAGMLNVWHRASYERCMEARGYISTGPREALGTRPD